MAASTQPSFEQRFLDTEARYEYHVAHPAPAGYTVTAYGWDDTCHHVHPTVDAAIDCAHRIDPDGDHGAWWTPLPAPAQ